MSVTQLVYPSTAPPPPQKKNFANDLFAISPGYYGRPERQRRKQFSCNMYFWGGQEQCELWQILSYASHKSRFWTVEQIVLSISNKLTEKAFLDTMFV